MPDTAQPNEPAVRGLADTLQALRGELRTLVDEIRVRVHLGSMDAKDAWGRAEDRIFEFEQQAAALGVDVGTELHNAEGEFAHAWNDLKVELLRIRGLIAARGTSQGPD